MGRPDLAKLANPERLTAWLDKHVPQLGNKSLDVQWMTGGTSNIVLSINRGVGDMVLRRPPEIPPPGSAKTVLREARVLTALNASTVPHPFCFAACEDSSVIGAPFFVMERVPGWSAQLTDGRMVHPPPFDTPPDETAIAYAIVDGLIALAKVDYRLVGLADFGKPENFLERQVDRWVGQLDSYDQLYGYKGRALPGYDYVRDWLRANTPSDYPIGILHGDIGTQNALFAHQPPARLNALIDWELSTLGDPLLDLAWFCSGLRDEREPGRISSRTLYDVEHFPTRQELVRYYAAGTGRDVSRFDYYLVLALFKSGCILEYKVAQSQANILPKETGAFFAKLVLASFAEGERLARRLG